MERQPWTFERFGTELQFFLLQLAGILFGSFAKHFSPVMSLLCLIALLSMHAFSSNGVVRWEEIRVLRGLALCDLVLSKIGEIIFISVALSWQVRFIIDFLCVMTDCFLTHWIGRNDRIVGEFMSTYCIIPPLRQFECFCHIFFLYYFIVLLKVMHNMTLE